VSSLVAAGGGFLSIPFMVFCNVVIHQAVGTSAALGFPIAVAGTVGYILSGMKTQRPARVFARLHLPAGLCRRGGDEHADGAARRRLAHKLPVKAAEARLRRLPRAAGDAAQRCCTQLPLLRSAVGLVMAAFVCVLLCSNLIGAAKAAW
jgi:hypothetical protein